MTAPAAVGAARPGDDARSTGGLLELDDITFAYGVVPVLFGVSLRLDPGERLALLGTNGAGKSTLLRIVAGLNRPSGGRVVLDGEEVTGSEAAAMLRRGIVLVPENKAIFPDLTVAENLEIGAYGLRKTRDVARQRTERVLEIFPRLGERLRQLAGSMSGGEKQMLSLGKAFLLQPRILLIDELSLGLAPVVVEVLLEAVRSVREEGTSVILVEQSFNIAASLCDRAVFIQKGAVQFEGGIAELVAEPGLAEAVFFGGHGEGYA